MFYGRPERRAETNKRRQEVPIPAPLLAHLRRWQRAGQRHVVEWHGEPVKRISKAHAAAVAAAGFDSDVTPHTWRHSVATWLMQRGADVGEAAQHLAMTEETLLRVYKHHRPGYLASVHGAI
jgi:integrase